MRKEENEISMDKNKWISLLKVYEGASTKKSILQFVITSTLYVSLMLIMIQLQFFGVPYWIILLLSIPTAGFHIKLFIIMHDCGHHSFFHSTKACTFIGRICATMTFTPYYDWRRSHAIHHATVSNLDKKGTGDVWTMTVTEYMNSSTWRKMRYRVFRNPFFLFFIAPIFLFLIVYRLPHKRMSVKEIKSVMLTNVALGGMITILSFLIGFFNYIRIIFPVVLLASIFGIWLFYLQHQFINVYWSDTLHWSSFKAAMEGSSFIKLPSVMRWLSGNIGYHHIHHLDPRIPNYKLKLCYDEIPDLREITPITIRSSFRLLFLYLWDESSGTLVNIGKLKKGRKNKREN